MNWILTSERTPPDGQWCWLSDGSDVWGPAVRDHLAAGGWSNEDTWEDFHKEVTMWWAIEEPARPYMLASEDANHGHCDGIDPSNYMALCPDCRSTANLVRNEYRGIWEVRCIHCPTFVWDETPDTAIDRWNRASSRITSAAKTRSAKPCETP